MPPFQYALLLHLLWVSPLLADWHCPDLLGRLYAKGLRDYWTSNTKDFAETVFAPLLDRGFDHEAILALEDAIIDNFDRYRPTGNAAELAKVLHVSDKNAQMILTFYDLGGQSGTQTTAGFDAYNHAKQHVRQRLFLPLTLYLEKNQTKKDITLMTKELRERLKSPELTESKVYHLMWLSNHEMYKAWEKPVSSELLEKVQASVTEPVPTTLGALAVHLYQQRKWGKSDIAKALDISELSFTHHLHAEKIEPNIAEWSDVEEQILREHYGQLPTRELQEILGRTEASIRGHAAELNLTKPGTGPGPDLYLKDGNVTAAATEGDSDVAIKKDGALQEAILEAYLKEHYLAGKTLTEVARALEVSPTTLGQWNIRLGLYPSTDAKRNQAEFDLGKYLASKPKQGAAIFEAFLNGGLQLPPRKGGKGDPGAKLSAALNTRKPANVLIAEIPESVRQAHPNQIEAFRKAYQQRLNIPLIDRSRKPGDAIFEAFLNGGLQLPPRKGGKGGKGDPGAKLSAALNTRKPANVLIAEIPEDVRKNHPDQVEAFRAAYQNRLDSPLKDTSRTQGDVIFEAFLDGGSQLPTNIKGKGAPGARLKNALAARKTAAALIEQIPEDVRKNHPDQVEAFREAYEKRLQALPQK